MVLLALSIWDRRTTAASGDDDQNSQEKHHGMRLNRLSLIRAGFHDESYAQRMERVRGLYSFLGRPSSDGTNFFRAITYGLHRRPS